MMNLKEMRKYAIIERLRQTRHEIAVLVNHIHALDMKYPGVPNAVMRRNETELYFDLEVSLTMASLLIRKLVENHVIEISEGFKSDVNALIHSVYFDYYPTYREVKVKSRKGQEVVLIDDLLRKIDEIMNEYHLN